jgi:hypothetical protein
MTNKDRSATAMPAQHLAVDEFEAEFGYILEPNDG